MYIQSIPEKVHSLREEEIYEKENSRNYDSDDPVSFSDCSLRQKAGEFCRLGVSDISGDPHADTDAHADTNADPNTNAHTDTDPNTNPHTDADAHADTCSGSRERSHGYGRPDR